MTTQPKAPRRLSSTSLPIRVVGLYGFLGLLVGLVFLYQAAVPKALPPPPTQLSTVNVDLPNSQPTKTGTPNRLVVPRLGLTLPILNGYYDPQTNDWTLSDTDAFFATMTDLPNDKRGSTFIYGHNRPTAFESLKNIAAGDTVDVYTSNGLKFTYEYAQDAIIQPTTTNVLNDDPDHPQLVLMTCEGVWSEVRRLMYFNLKEVRNV